jgi:putative aldouronate transport system permease protein
VYYKSMPYRISYIVIVVVLCLAAFLCILPMVHILAISLSGKAPTSANLVHFWPMDFTVDAYRKTLGNAQFGRALYHSIIRTVLGVAVGMFICLITAYPLSKATGTFRGKDIYLWYFVFTMLFSGGLIPIYIVMRQLHLLNTIWALILPTAVSVWNIILMLNFFRTIPRELEEAAVVDGASQYRTLFQIFVPLAMPSIVTLSLFTLVGHWNSWFDGMIYMTKPDNWPLATLLQSIIVQVDFSKLSIDPNQLNNISDRTVKAAQIFIGALPILILYPFLQRFFIKGMVVGAVKE